MRQGVSRLRHDSRQGSASGLVTRLDGAFLLVGGRHARHVDGWRDQDVGFRYFRRSEIAGLPAIAVDVRGTYAGGSMMGPSTPKPGCRLLGAIVAGPGGNVFFKLTGPEETVSSAENSFRKLLDGLKKK